MLAHQGSSLRLTWRLHHFEANAKTLLRHDLHITVSEPPQLARSELLHICLSIIFHT